MGGYRKGSGRSKSGYYKGIYCGSTYELCWVIYNLDYNIPFSRFPGKLEKDGIVYYPDFLLSDNKTIVETKGYEKQISVDRKTQVAESFGYTVKVLRKDDLQYAFNYVEKTYGTKKFYSLYDNYKPKYSHVCNYCNKVFKTDRKIKTETKFCSRSCAGKYRKEHKVDPVRKIKVALHGEHKMISILKEKQGVIKMMANLEELVFAEQIEEGTTAGAYIHGVSIYLYDLSDPAQEKARLEKEQQNLDKFIQNIEAKLSNKGFTDKAPEAVVQKQRDNLQEAKEKLEKVQALLESIS